MFPVLVFESSHKTIKKKLVTARKLLQHIYNYNWHPTWATTGQNTHFKSIDMCYKHTHVRWRQLIRVRQPSHRQCPFCVSDICNCDKDDTDKNMLRTDVSSVWSSHTRHQRNVPHEPEAEKIAQKEKLPSWKNCEGAVSKSFTEKGRNKIHDFMLQQQIKKNWTCSWAMWGRAGCHSSQPSFTWSPGEGEEAVAVSEETLSKSSSAKQRPKENTQQPVNPAMQHLLKQLGPNEVRLNTGLGLFLSWYSKNLGLVVDPWRSSALTDWRSLTLDLRWP